MNTRAKTTYLLTILLLGLFLCAWPATGFSKEGRSNGTEAGHIVAGSGRLLARAKDGSERRLRRRSAIYTGDTIIVGDNAFIQIRFTDGGLTSLRPGTEFRVSEYSFNGEQDGSEKAMFDLVKGGLRTITGTIGKQNKKNYQLNTPVSTIGIRGTHYGVNLCDAGCLSASGEPLPAGLYGGVVDGAIVVSNEGGETFFGNDHYFHVADSYSPPQELLGPPGVVFDPIEVQSQPEQEEQTDTQAAGDGGDQPITESETVAGTTEFDATGMDVEEFASIQLIEAASSVDPGTAPGSTGSGVTSSGLDAQSTSPTNTTTGTGATSTTTTITPTMLGLTPAPIGSVALIAGIPPALGPEPFAEIVPQKGTMNDEIWLDTINGAGNIVSHVVHYESPDCLTCEVNRGSATLVNVGGMANPGINWGRWEGDWYAQDSYGSGLGQGSWHYIYSPNVTTDNDLLVLKNNNVLGAFDLVAGSGTTPTDEHGNLGTYSTTPRMYVDFGTSQIIFYEVGVDINGVTLYGALAGGNSVTFSGPGAKMFLDVRKGANWGGMGEANVVFVGPLASHALSNFWLQYGTNSAVGTHVMQR